MKMPINLYQLCIDNILHNSNYWHRIKKDYEERGLIGGPFNGLPPSLQQEILEGYEQVDMNHKMQSSTSEDQDKWRLFITRGVSTLSINEYTDRSTIVHIAATCRNLQHLEIKNMTSQNVSMRTLAAFVLLKRISPCLTTLISIKLECSTKIKGRAIVFVREHCPNLRMLSLKGCYVTDKAMRNLTHMPTLLELDLRETEVTYIGLQDILKYNPQLRSLNHPCVVRSVFKLHTVKSWLKRTQPSYFALRDITIVLDGINLEPLELVTILVKCCPDMERIRLELDILSSPLSLKPLGALQRLVDLNVQSVVYCTKKSPLALLPPPHAATLFEISLHPLLTARGAFLTTLTLENVLGVDMMIIEQNCTHLVTLGLFYNTYLEGSFPNDTKPLTTLRRFLFGSGFGPEGFPAWYLERLLSNPNLEVLALSGSPLFSNELFTRLFSTSGAFRQLRRLELEYSSVSLEVVTEFLTQCSRKSLKELSICGPYAREQAAQLRSHIAREKLDVKLEAFYYSFVRWKKSLIRYKQDIMFDKVRGRFNQTNG